MKYRPVKNEGNRQSHEVTDDYGTIRTVDRFLATSVGLLEQRRAAPSARRVSVYIVPN